MDLMTDRWSSLINEVQKHILSKPSAKNLYVSQEVYAWFSNAQNPIETPSKQEEVITPTTQVYKPPVPKPVVPIKIAPPPEGTPPLPPSRSPSYDFNSMKTTMEQLKPGLKILDLEKEPACLIFGYYKEQEQEMMENIKKAIEGNLHKNVLIISETLSEVEYRELFTKKSLVVSIISQEMLDNIMPLKTLFKQGTPFHYLAGLPVLLINTFRGLKSDQEEKRVLWNQLKTFFK